MKYKNENGIISIFIVFGMLFLLISTINMYYIINHKAQIQDEKVIEIKKIYSDNYEKMSEIENEASGEIVPIYNAEQLNLIGSNNYIQIRDRIYQCGTGRTYILKDNIIIDIEGKIKTNLISSCDYKLYSSNYYIDNNNNSIYYYKDGEYWVNLAYQRFSEKNKNFVNRPVYVENEFSILQNYKFTPGTNKFLLIWTDDNGKYSNEASSSQNITKTRLNSLDEIDVFRNNKNKLNRNDGKFYIFVCIGKNI